MRKKKFWTKPLVTGLLLGTLMCHLAPVQAGGNRSESENTLWSAASRGDLATVKQLLKANPKLLNARPDPGDSLLEAAAMGGATNVFKYLLTQGASLDKSITMIAAVSRGNLEIIRLVIAKGANANTRNPNDNSTPIVYAAPKLDVIRFLVEKGADVNSKNKQGRTVLLGAARGAQPEVINYLISLGADVKASDMWGKTVLHELCEGPLTDKQLEVARTFVEKGAPVNALINLQNKDALE